MYLASPDYAWARRILASIYFYRIAGVGLSGALGLIIGYPSDFPFGPGCGIWCDFRRLGGPGVLIISPMSTSQKSRNIPPPPYKPIKPGHRGNIPRICFATAGAFLVPIHPKKTHIIISPHILLSIILPWIYSEFFGVGILLGGRRWLPRYF